jgi:hypothetical protein
MCKLASNPRVSVVSVFFRDSNPILSKRARSKLQCPKLKEYSYLFIAESAMA